MTGPGPGVAAASARDGKVALVFNSGSSSLRFGLFVLHDGVATTWLDGEFAGLGSAVASLQVVDGDGAAVDLACIGGAGASSAVDPAAGVGIALRLLQALALPPPIVVGHRVVHGGAGLRGHAVIDAQTRAAIVDAVAFAPLHTPATLQVIDAARQWLPDLPHVACLDTCFHRGLPAEARTLAIGMPARGGAARADDVHRSGFHGLACESLLQQLGTPPPSRLVLAHLGSGASVTAVRDGHSIDTTMGLSPAGGLLMATRSGDVDPGALVYLARTRGWNLDDIEHACTRSGGMAAIGGHGGDMRALRRAAGRDANAALAIRMFCQSVARAIAGMLTVLGGADAIVFSGGIGSNDAEARAAICAALAWCDVHVDAAANLRGAPDIHAAHARCQVRVLHAREEAQIARHACAFVQANGLGTPPPAGASAAT